MKRIMLGTMLTMSLVIASSCQKGNTSNEELQRQNDSLMLVNAQTKAEYDEMLQLINEVQAGFDQIKSAENYLIVQQNSGGDLDKSVRDKIAEDMTLISKTLKENKEKINKLMTQIKSSNNQSAQLKESVERLNKMIEERGKMITDLQEELAKRDVRIAELDDAVMVLSQMNTSQSEIINRQDISMNKVFYAFGTSKELREQGIIEARGKNRLTGDYNKDYFTAVDLRELKTVPLGAKKAKLLTSHPDGSYTLEKDDDGILTLVINNPEEFWSTSKYLVIQVD